MTSPLRLSITRIPADESPPAILVGPADNEADAAELYRRFSASSVSPPAGEQLVTIVSTGPLNTPDMLTATGRRTKPDHFDVNLEIRRYDGPLAANVRWTGLVSMDLGALRPGDYQVSVRENTARFTDLEHPESAEELTTAERSADFGVTA